MKLRQKYGNWACVAGAGEGFGKALAKGLAKRGFHLILIDHKKELLKETIRQLHGEHSIKIIPLYLDLGNLDCIDQIMKNIREKQCRFLVYNAAYGPVKAFVSNSSDELGLYIRVNMEAPIKLIHKLVQNYKNPPLGILMISSLAGFRGTQYVVPYSATKSWTWNLAEGLYYELRDSKFDISVCCPGITDTPNYRSTKPKTIFFTPKPMPPEKVAEEALNKFGKKLFIIPGIANRISHFILNRILPRKIASGIHNYTMKKMYG